MTTTSESTVNSEILLIQNVADYFKRKSNSMLSGTYIESPSHSPTSSEDLSSETDAINNFVKEYRIENFIEIINLYDDLDFKRHFKVSRVTANFLIDNYKLSAICPNKDWARTGPEKDVYIFLWYTANNVIYRQVANLFGISYKTAWSVINRLSIWIVSVADSCIKHPILIRKNMSPFERMKEIAEFYHNTYFKLNIKLWPV